MAAEARLIVNIDVPDLAAATRFYADAIGLTPARLINGREREMLGQGFSLWLLARAEGAGGRDYRRHWCPIHLDFAVDDHDAASARALAAGALLESGPEDFAFGRIATFADPFGHGFCLTQFSAEGYDAQ